MTARPDDQQPTHQPSQATTRAHQHNPATTDSSRSPTRRKINNLSTHLGITIRRIQEPGQSRHGRLILNRGVLGRDRGVCSC